MKDKDFLHIIDKYAEQKANDNETKLVDHFFEKSQSIHSKGQSDANKLVTKKRVLHKIHQEIGVKKQVTFYHSSVFRYAASILFLGLLVGLYFSSQKAVVERITIQTAVGEQKVVKLPDGSTVHLNNLSSLSYGSDFEKNRVLELQGEAFFDVQKDSLHPFQVLTKNTVTQVLGTSFNIKSYDETDVKVVVRTGKVNVKSRTDHKNSVDLLPQQMTNYKGELKVLERIITTQNEDFQWMNKVIVFDHTPIESAIEELERWYNIEIDIADHNIKNCQLNGKYKVGKLEEILEGLAFMNNIQYQFQDKDVIVLSGRGCQSQ
ncbi:FecR family protein [Flammeovirga sp. OC4]|uniref:FecR family protein n=1 Tax=Flammeovirga sp. OC4 TaxID=1382345 RepID=UPI0005C658C6|nr:FecR domain-containing protein [Flammeovirga sp. OC4]